MSSKHEQAPKLPIVWICILTISAIVAPYVIINTFKQDIEDYKKAITDKLPQPPKTYTASNFTTYGNAVNDGNWIGNINAGSGFNFTVNSDNQTIVKLNIKYKSDRQGGILKVNGKPQTLYFPSTKGNWQNKIVIIQMQQGENSIAFCSGWLTDFAPDIAEIKIVADSDIKKDYIAGVWKGTYDRGKGKATLSINDDLTGVFEFVRNEGKGSYSVRVNNSKGRYSISGLDWIDKPKSGWWSFASFTGTIIDGKLSWSDFSLEKSGTVVLLSTSNNKPHNWRFSFNTPADNWYLTSFIDNQWQQGNAPFGNEQNLQNTRWTTSQIFIRTQFNVSDVSSIDNAYFCVWHDEDVQIYLNGQLALNRSGYITNYEYFEFDKTLLTNGKNTIAAKCTQIDGGQLIDIGVFVNTENNAPPPLVRENNTAKVNADNISTPSQSSYIASVDTPGRFPQASERLLSEADLSGLSKYDLKIMRNEIFARHGYIFQTNDMKNYFQNQSWYSPRYSNVNTQLTNIEQKNITLIQRYE